jgi:hypothetical protein
MYVVYPYPDAKARRETPRYVCRQKSGSNQTIMLTHRTQIRVPSIDARAREKIAEVVKNPAWVRAGVEEL